MVAQAQDAVLLARDVGGVRVLRMNRPAKRNALDTALTQALVGALRAAGQDAGVGAIVLAGEGAAFCAGADVAEFARLTPANAVLVEQRAELTATLHGLFPALAKPVVAAVGGAAMGGGAGLALACDLLVMGRGASLGYPEIRRGIVPAIVMAGLVRQLGRKLAFELAGLGLPIDADTALRWGLANRVVADAEVDDTALALATALAGHSRQAMAAVKGLLGEVGDLAFAQGLERGRQVNVQMRGFDQ